MLAVVCAEDCWVAESVNGIAYSMHGTNEAFAGVSCAGDAHAPRHCCCRHRRDQCYQRRLDAVDGSALATAVEQK